jgi:NTE family protein
VLALVLSGAANFGAMQAGALQALFEYGFKPDMVVGTSAGALNAIQVASNPTEQGIVQLRKLWENVSPQYTGKPTLISGIRRALTRKESLLVTEPLVGFIEEQLPISSGSFGQLRGLHNISAYAMAVQLETGELIAFGDNPQDRLVDGAMASTALPPYFPPWRVGDYRYVDGGLISKLPIRSAIERGATQLIAVDVRGGLGSPQSANDLIAICGYALSLMSDNQAQSEISWAKSTGVALRVIVLSAPDNVSFWDYSQSGYLYETGYQSAKRALEEEPLQIFPTWQLQVRKNLTSAFKSLLGTPN